MENHDFLVTILGYLSEVLGTLSGFGSSIFFLPATSIFERLQFAMVLTAILHCFGNVSKITLFWGSFDSRAFLRLVIPSVVFAGVGALLSGFGPPALLTRWLGAFLVVVPLLMVFGKRYVRAMPPWAAHSLAGLSGFFSGLIGTGGALRGVALSALQLEKTAFVSLSATIDLWGDLLRAAIYIWQGYMDWDQWHYLPLLGAAAILGSWSGKKLLLRLRQEAFEVIVALFVMVSGCWMLFS